MKKRSNKGRLTLYLALALGALVASGCGDDPSTNNTTIRPGSDTSIPSVDAGDATVDVLDVNPGDATDVQDAPEQTVDLCDAVNDLGTIEANGGASANGSTAGGTSIINPSCGGSDVQEVVYQFSVDGTARVEVQVHSQDTDDWSIGVYRGNCDSPERIKCEDVRSDVFVAEPGINYFLSVEPRDIEEASFRLTLSMTALECAPMGSTTCDGDNVTRCESGFQEVTYSCAYACSQSACGADICANAIEVAGAGSHSFTGSYAGYGSNFDFQNRDDCTSASVGLDTPGQDLVFFLPSLSQGQTVTVDASADDNQEGVFVLENTCSAQAACAAGGYAVGGVYEWTVEADGDYYVVVDLIEATTSDFDLTITR